MGALDDKVVIVTGASSGIGRASAELFAAEGAKLVVAARRQDRLDELVAEIGSAGGEAVALAGDVSSEEFAAALVDEAVSRFGGLDASFNNAGTLGPNGPTHETSVADWNETIQTNLTACFFAARHQVPAMLERGGGSLVFTSSPGGYHFSFPGMSAYSASKAGLIGLVKSLAVELGPQGIRANALLPGVVMTEMFESFAPSQEARDGAATLMALKRVGESEELARSALYLVSDQSSFTTGTALLADGGISVNRT